MKDILALSEAGLEQLSTVKYWMYLWTSFNQMWLIYKTFKFLSKIFLHKVFLSLCSRKMAENYGHTFQSI